MKILKLLMLIGALFISLPSFSHAEEAAKWSFSANPLNELEGVWHEESMKIDITVKSGVVTITKMESQHPTAQAMEYKAGVILGKLTGFKPDGERLVRFEGTTRTKSNGKWVLDTPCIASMMLYMRQNKQYPTFNISALKFKRSADISSADLESRR